MMLMTPDVVEQIRQDQPLAWLGGLRASEFLRDYWQKKPLHVRGAFPALAELLEPADLLELAEDPDAESRVILEQGKTPWELRHGPFTPADIRRLPARQWTLLVQAVDHYLPALADLLDHFAFVPDWRIDDVMVSYARPGGSVGPHFDQYDVFLIQGPGQRYWQLGDMCNDATPRLEHADLRLIADMPVRFEAIVEAGDLLYVPPGLAHNGVAVTECLTYSVGFRAPPLSELLERLVDTIAEQDSQPLFSDSQRALTRQPANLESTDIGSIREQMLHLLADEERLTQALAPYLSEPKYLEYEPQGESLSRRELREFLVKGGDLLRDPASRIIWRPETQTLWCNGNAEHIPGPLLVWIDKLIQGRRISHTRLHDAPEFVLDWLCGHIAKGLWLSTDGSV